MSQNKREIPLRLMNQEFIGPSSDFFIFETTLIEPYWLHWHEFYEIEFILEGSWTNVINGTAYPTDHGRFFLLTPADFHEVVPDKDPNLKLINIRFSDRLISHEVREMIFNFSSYPTVVFTGQEYDRIVRNLHWLISEMENKDIGSELVVKGILEHVLMQFIRKINKMYPDIQYPEIDKSKKSIRRALIFIQNHFRDDITLHMAAKRCYLSPNYFSERFRDETGVTFQEYIKEIRLKFAASLLLSSDIPITEICYASGFNTLTYFITAFKDRFGSSPSVFRKNNV